MTVKALLVPAEPTEAEPARLVDIEPNLSTLQKLVGGYIEAVGGDSWHCYLNEDGKTLGLPNNPDANRLVRSLGFELAVWDNIVGPAVFLGPDGAEEDDVPEFVVKMAREVGVLVPEATDKPIRVTFERIGRDSQVDPLVVPAGRNADQLAEAIFTYAYPKLASRVVNVVVDLERMGGTIFCGFHVGGSFTLEEIEGEG